MHVVMLRDIDANELGKLFTRGMQDNAPKGEFSKFDPRHHPAWPTSSRSTQEAEGWRQLRSVDFVPGVGTMRARQRQADRPTPIKEPEFFSALLRIWLGPTIRPTALLKDALLGKEARPESAGGSNLQ